MHEILCVSQWLQTLPQFETGVTESVLNSNDEDDHHVVVGVDDADGNNNDRQWHGLTLADGQVPCKMMWKIK